MNAGWLHTCRKALVFGALVITSHALMGQEILLTRQATLMGSVFDISIVDVDSAQANQHIDQVIAEVIRIENLISEWQPHTPISRVNQQAGARPVVVDREVFELTKRALMYSQLSDGAFDISVAGLDQVWRFDGSMNELPTEEMVQRSIAHVGYQYIVLDSAASSIYLSKKGMKIGFGSIGKGYAADKGRELMQKLGVKGGIVNASGDLATWGAPPQKQYWKIGLNHPFRPHKMIQVLKLEEEAVATSGSYQKYAEIAGTRYAHIINPKTGYPSTGLTSVSIYGPSCEMANALSTSIMVLGREKGKALMKAFPGYHYIFVTDAGRILKSRKH
ncbi:FAD:protein FMN transferase [Sphingobacterium sp. lm-10]|uniref:FAD:protein FMN transferase n=1 Tax=Sphingobacterium sp. lm-10 TaxID=2944904 RepID=UPI002021B7F6|nr:FAD:protein FMN transferase [Sphingobacterium sp. lm-10]MCL7987336.1 FAD:protein FMN transferase [Sphingobacterium sp. lm-10]